MKKMIIAAMVLLVAQIGLALALNISNKGISAGAPDTLFLTFSPDAVHSLEITNGEGKSVVIEKGKDGWIVPAHFSAPVDGTKVKGLVDKLAGIKQGFVVATTADAAKRFKVDAGSFEDHVVLKSADKTLADFYVGTSPAFRQIHARRDDSNQIVAIPLSNFELETAVDKWLDTSVGTIKDDDLTGLTIGEINLKKVADGWQLEGLKEGEKANKEEINTLVTKARGMSIEDVLDPAKVAELVAKPVFSYTTVHKDGRKVEYLFGKGKEDFYVMKLSDRDLYFKVHSLLVDAVRNITRDKLVKVEKAAESKVESTENAAGSLEKKAETTEEKAPSAK
jgi:hypothetical protein